MKRVVRGPFGTTAAIATAFGAWLCAAVALGAQEAPVFRLQSDLVVLHVNVFDKRSDAIPDLPRSAFHVVEDDDPQEIAFFDRGDVPVAVGLVVDNSGSMIARRAMVLAGARAFTESSRPQDELFTVIFNEDVRFGLPDGVLFTGSRAQVSAGLSQYPAGGKTALYDAVIAALDRLECATNQKRALVVLSDGSDNASRHSREEMFDRVRAADAIIYTVVERAGTRGPIGDPGVMKRLAELSGGVAYAARTEEDVIESFSESGANIRRGYRIGYVSSHGSDGGYHRVQVLVRMPGRSNLNARVRHGYTSHRAAGCAP